MENHVPDELSLFETLFHKSEIMKLEDRENLLEHYRSAKQDFDRIQTEENEYTKYYTALNVVVLTAIGYCFSNPIVICYIPILSLIGIYICLKWNINFNGLKSWYRCATKSLILIESRLSMDYMKFRKDSLALTPMCKMYKFIRKIHPWQFCMALYVFAFFLSLIRFFV